MRTTDFRTSCNEAVEFLQHFISVTNIDISVQPLSEEQFEMLVRDDRSELNWLAYFGHYLSDKSFHAGFKLSAGEGIDAAFLTVYSEKDKHLHVLMLESLVRNDDNHPLKGKLTALAIVAMTDLLSGIVDSLGAFIVQPDPKLVVHYKRFGFEVTQYNQNIMYANISTLQDIQKQIMNREQWTLA